MGRPPRIDHQVSGGSGKRVTVITPEMQDDFDDLRSRLNGAKFETEAAAVSAFERHFVPFTEKYGLEAGANVTYSGRYRLEDITLGSATGVATPFNRISVAEIHTHPAWGGDGFSGMLRYVNGDFQSSLYGDYGRTWNHAAYSTTLRASYVFRAGGPNQPMAAWKFDLVEFRNSYFAAKRTGADTYAEWFTRPYK